MTAMAVRFAIATATPAARAIVSRRVSLRFTQKAIDAVLAARSAFELAQGLREGSVGEGIDAAVDALPDTIDSPGDLPL